MALAVATQGHPVKVAGWPCVWIDTKSVNADASARETVQAPYGPEPFPMRQVQQEQMLLGCLTQTGIMPCLKGMISP